MFNFFRKKKPINIIAFDGPERVGKSTQIRMLQKYLESKKKKVLVLHTSLLGGHDVTRFKEETNVKNLMYIASLWSATRKATAFLAVHPKNGVVLFDRHILTQLAFCERFECMSLVHYLNGQFLRLIEHYLNAYGSFYTICMLGRRYDGSTIDIHLDRLFWLRSNCLKASSVIETSGYNRKIIHEKIKQVLGV